MSINEVNLQHAYSNFTKGVYNAYSVAARAWGVSHDTFTMLIGRLA